MVKSLDFSKTRISKAYMTTETKQTEHNIALIEWKSAKQLTDVVKRMLIMFFRLVVVGL